VIKNHEAQAGAIDHIYEVPYIVLGYPFSVQAHLNFQLNV